MANIDQYIEQIANARYGEEVRQSIIDALQAMNAEIGSGGVTSFNTRTGDVVSANSDYNIGQIASTGGVEGQVPVVNRYGGFTMRDVSGDVEVLNQLSDVNIYDPVNGQILKYNEATDKWENSAGGGTGGSGALIATGSRESSSAGGVHDTFLATDSNVTFSVRGLPISKVNNEYYLHAEVSDRMPTPSGTCLSTHVLYVGDTTSDYTRGSVYKCVLNNSTYSWNEVCNLLNGGTNVVANPSGTASADLVKIQIGNDIYSIPTGGSGGTDIKTVATQTGVGTKSATVDVSAKASILCMVKKGTDIIVSKEIPTASLSVGDVIPLNVSSEAVFPSKKIHTYADTTRELSAKERNRIKFQIDNNLDGYYQVMLTGNGLGSGILQANGDAEILSASETNLYPNNLYSDIPQTTMSVNLGDATSATAKVTYSATNTFTLAVTDANLTLILFAIASGSGSGGSGVNPAPEFSTSTAYGMGDYVTYNGATYRFISAKTAGAWDSIKVTQQYTMGAYVTAGKKANTTLGLKATAEGEDTTASGYCSHAEGEGTTASGYDSHAEGYGTTASSDFSHAEGFESTASEYCSHAEGEGTQTGADYQHVQGKYNVGKTNTLFEIGNGTSNNARSNAFEVDASGNVTVYGNLTVVGTITHG